MFWLVLMILLLIFLLILLYLRIKEDQRVKLSREEMPGKVSTNVKLKFNHEGLPAARIQSIATIFFSLEDSISNVISSFPFALLFFTLFLPLIRFADYTRIERRWL